MGGRSLIAAVLLTTFMACETSEAPTPGPVDPLFPDARLERVDRTSSSQEYFPEGADNACPVTLASFLSGSQIEEVVGFYEDEGFELIPEAGYDNGELIRWIGERQGDEESYRRVDIATGEVFGHPEAATGFDIFKPNCTGAQAGESVATAEPAPPRPPRRPGEVFTAVGQYRFPHAPQLEGMSITRHLRRVDPEAFSKAAIRRVRLKGERLPANVAVARYDFPRAQADVFVDRSLAFLRSLGDGTEEEIFGGFGFHADAGHIAAVTFFVRTDPLLLVHVVGRPPTDVMEIATLLFEANR